MQVEPRATRAPEHCVQWLVLLQPEQESSSVLQDVQMPLRLYVPPMHASTHDEPNASFGAVQAVQVRELLHD